MLIKCNYCGQKARITNRHSISTDYSKLYCQCLNDNCNHRFSMLLTFESTLQPPLPVSQKLIIEAALSSIKDWSKKDKQAFIDQLVCHRV